MGVGWVSMHTRTLSLYHTDRLQVLGFADDLAGWKGALHGAGGLGSSGMDS
jgi:hypothetical protein